MATQTAPAPANTATLPSTDDWSLDITVTHSPRIVPTDCGTGDGCKSSCASSCVSA